MILDAALWLPTKVLKCVLRPVTAMLEELQTIEDYFKEDSN